VRVKWGSGKQRGLGLMMRTPGSDDELAAGLLFGEGIVHHRREIRRIRHEPSRDEAQEFNSVLVELASSPRVDWEALARPLSMSSACGVCGRASVEYLRRSRPAAGVKQGLRVSASLLWSLPERLGSSQEVFAATGGLHAAALFDAKGRLLEVREDVGRHNAVDKLVGHALLENRLPLGREILLVSGRAGFEILQKAVRAGCQVVAAVGAPSSLAAEVAREFGVTPARTESRIECGLVPVPQGVRCPVTTMRRAIGHQAVATRLLSRWASSWKASASCRYSWASSRVPKYSNSKSALRRASASRR
jgi:FdhD protein